MPIKNLIITGANTAREINPFVKPVPYAHSMDDRDISEIIQDYHRKLKRFEESESSLKEYRITPNPEECKAFEAIEEKVGGKITHLNYGTTLPVGTKAECETNEELLTFYIL